MARTGTAALGLLAALALAGRASAQRESVERELRIRDAACGPVAKLLEGSADPLPELERIEALRRALVVGADDARDGARWLAEVWFAANDVEARPQTRVALLSALADARIGLKLLACFGVGGGAPTSETSFFASDARDDLPTVRLGAARALEGCEGADELLLALAFDEDERVAHAARESLFLGAERHAATLGAVARRVASEGDLDAWSELVKWLERAPADDALVGAFRAALDAGPFDELTKTQWRGALEALRVVHGLPADLDLLVAAWPGPPGGDGLFVRAARTARARGTELGGALLSAAERCDVPERRAELLAGAAEALDARELLRRAEGSSALTDADRLALWGRLRGRSEPLDARDAALWLASRRPLELRREIVDVLRHAGADDAGAAARDWLAFALDDPDDEVVAIAFKGLCDARPIAPWLDELHAAWKRMPDARRSAALAELPRETPLGEFRASLLELADASGPQRATAFELLAGFAPDAELAQRAERWLDDELAALAAASEGGFRERELRAMGAVRALHKLSGGAALDAMEAAAVRVRALSVEVGKLALASLGTSAEGRARLAPWLDGDAPSRLRIEAELILAQHGSTAAVDGLARDWARCDFELRSRSIRACAGLATPRELAFVRAIALRADADEVHRAQALDALAGATGLGPDVETLTRIAEGGALDLRRQATIALGGVRSDAVVARLRERLAALEAQPEDVAGSGERAQRGVDREALLTALGRAGVFDADVVRAWLRWPAREAAAQLEARFRGRAQPGVEFARQAELDYASALARARRLAPALDASAGWQHLDARFLIALADRARDADDLEPARTLLRAAWIGLLGEAATDERAARLFELRHRLLDGAERLRAWGECAGLASALLADYRARRVPDRAFERAFGGFDPAAGSDGVARLTAAVQQAWAWQAIDSASSAVAHLHAARAAAALGFSREARAAQEKLEDALARLDAK